MKSKQQFHILFCMRFSAMHFYAKLLSTLKSLGGITVMLIALKC